MSEFIKDGTGTGNRLRVDVNNRAHALAVSVPYDSEAGIEQRLFNVNTGTISLTSDSASTVFYIKNTGTTPWVIPRVFFNLGNSTGGSGDVFIEIIKNPSAGTIVSAGTNFTPKNFDISSARILVGDFKKGAEGSTVTDGESFAETISSSVGRVLIPFAGIVIRQGSSIAARVTPPPGNTSMNLNAGANLFEYEINP